MPLIAFSRSSAFMRFGRCFEVLGPEVVVRREVGLRAGLEVLDAALKRLLDLLNHLLLLGLEAVHVLLDFLLELAEVLLARVLVDVGDDRRGEVENLLEVLRSHVEQVADAARDALEEPDVADRRGEVDVAHALAADLQRVTSTPQRSQTMPL